MGDFYKIHEIILTLGWFHLFERRYQLAVFLQMLGGDLQGTDLI